jgi:hypothetical protein
MSLSVGEFCLDLSGLVIGRLATIKQNYDWKLYVRIDGVYFNKGSELRGNAIPIGPGATGQQKFDVVVLDGGLRPAMSWKYNSLM